METVLPDVPVIDAALTEKSSDTQLAALALQLAAAQSAVAAALVRRAQQRNQDDGGDRLLTIQDAAKLLAVPPNFLYRNARKLKLAIKLGDGTIRVSRERLRQFIREQGRDGLNAA